MSLIFFINLCCLLTITVYFVFAISYTCFCHTLKLGFFGESLKFLFQMNIPMHKRDPLVCVWYVQWHLLCAWYDMRAQRVNIVYYNVTVLWHFHDFPPTARHYLWLWREESKTSSQFYCCVVISDLIYPQSGSRSVSSSCLICCVSWCLEVCVIVNCHT